jgi:RNA polymerase-binding transcription factor DksA
MDALTTEQLAELTGRIGARKARLLEEIRRGLANPRLCAYPTAKRCLRCQQEREKSGRYGARPTL